ncbi:MAG: hypothetical protein LC624_02005 [Halobacteriales archaeon]|nr:hypothetical protein [Halobacteriales archaeon]
MSENTCSCGRSFPATLDGAWAAREHADATGHALARPAMRRTPAPRASPA